MRASPIILLTLAALACTETTDDTGQVQGDMDGDGFFAPADCDDNDPAVHPGGNEVCNGADDDCDGKIDNNPVDPSAWYGDADGDGFGDVGDVTSTCDAPAGTVDNHDDCNDDDAAINPDATEICDGEDNDCDGKKDAADDSLDLSTTGTWYADMDGDGYGDSGSPKVACEQPASSSTDDTDCDDDNGTVYPGAEEVCADGLVNDCAGSEEEARAECGLAWPESTADADFRFDDENAGGWGGYSVSAAGDVNGDDKADMVVGAPYDSSSSTGEGRAYLLLGGVTASGDLTDADATVTGTTSNGALGTSVAIASDLNADGFDDLIVGAPGDLDATAGAVYVNLGPVSGAIGDSDADVVFYPLDGGDAGGAVVGLGDVDGDGIGDMLVGSPNYQGADGIGRAYLVLGAADLSGAVSPTATFESPSGADWAGYFAAAAGDTDGDGLQDMLIGGPYTTTSVAEEGAAWLVLGDAALSDGGLDTVASATFNGETEGGFLGAAVASAGDFDGDGLADVALGEPGAATTDMYEGRAYVFLSGEGGDLSTSDADVVIDGTELRGFAGASVFSAGDLDEDGNDDLLVGATHTDWPDDSGTGRVYLVLGGVIGTVGLGDAAAVLTSDEAGDGLGTSLAAGDTNGDGYTDVLIGAPGSNKSGADAGSVYLLLGQHPY